LNKLARAAVRTIRISAFATLIFWLGFFSASKYDSLIFSSPAPAAEAKAPDFAQRYAEAVCDKDGQYLTDNASPGLQLTPDAVVESLNEMFDACTGVQFLGGYSPFSDLDAIDYVFVLTYGDSGANFWVFTVYKGQVVNIQ
jgi:hypothetical protein